MEKAINRLSVFFKFTVFWIAYILIGVFFLMMMTFGIVNTFYSPTAQLKDELETMQASTDARIIALESKVDVLLQLNQAQREAK